MSEFGKALRAAIESLDPDEPTADLSPGEAEVLADWFLVSALGWYQHSQGGNRGKALRHIYKELAQYWPKHGAPIVKSAVTPLMRQRVFLRDGGRCVVCGATENLAVDHIIPESKGGPAVLPNFQTLCWSCNSSKGAKL